MFLQFHVEFPIFPSPLVLNRNSRVLLKLRENEKKNCRENQILPQRIWLKWPGPKSSIFLFLFFLHSHLQSPQCQRCAETCYDHCFPLSNGRYGTSPIAIPENDNIILSCNLGKRKLIFSEKVKLSTNLDYYMHKINYQREMNIFVCFLILFTYMYFKGYLIFQSRNMLSKLFYFSTLYANRLPFHLFLSLWRVWKGIIQMSKNQTTNPSPEKENILIL